jgi:poly-beta-1,6-N-acetyl-D-glucosamine synthase
VMVFSFETFLNYGIFVYVFLFVCSSVVIVILSSIEINYYKKKNRYETFKSLLVSPFAPSVSVIVPVNNLQSSIVDTVRALFALKYNNFDIIVVNDGSSDSTLIQLKKFYQLQLVEYAVPEQIKTQRIHGYYKSANPVFSKLIVVDKVYGGRADALNAGVNASEKDLVLCIDMHCFLNRDALLKLVKPFLEEKEQVIAARSVIHLANSSEKKEGHLIKLKFPRNLLAAFQSIEYFKKFLTERMAWSRINGLPLFSGTMNLFDKEVIIESGAYNSRVLNPDFELLIRMCRYMHDNSKSYKLAYIAESICRIEAPERLKALGRERKNWTAGVFQALRLHKNLFFNFKYGQLGLLNVPVWVFSTCIPYFKVLLLVLIVAGAFLSTMNWEFAGILLFTVYFFSVLMSVISILFEERSSRSYTSGTDVMKILLLSIAEPVVYRPLVLYWQIASTFGRRK